jgi:hypothetical protein
MKRWSPGALAALVLVLITIGFVVYSAVITPRMDSGVPEQGYRPPIQDIGPPPASKQPPLQKSNVPPASQQSR